MAHTDRKISKGNEYAYRIYELDNWNRISMPHTDREISNGNEYAYRIYDCTQEKILCHTDRKISKG